MNAQLETLLTTHTWGDTRGAVAAVDDCVARLAEVLTPELFSLEREGWPAWLDGREGDEFNVDPASLDDGDRTLLAAAIVHDLFLNWHGGPDSASWPLRRILEAL